MSRVARSVAAGFLLAALCAAPAHAQTDSKLAVGLSLLTRHAPDESSDSDGGHDVQLEWRFGHTRKTSWGWQWSGLDWFTTDIQREIGGAATNLGELRM